MEGTYNAVFVWNARGKLSAWRNWKLLSEFVQANHSNDNHKHANLHTAEISARFNELFLL